MALFHVLDAPCDATDNAKDLRRYCAEALTRADAPQRFTALDNSNLVGRGVLLCAVNAGGVPQRSPQLQVPMDAEPHVMTLWAKVFPDKAAMRALAGLYLALPGDIGLAFQFVPAEMWKTICEPTLKVRLSRKSLKATNVLRLIMCCVLPESAPLNDTHSGRMRVAALDLVRAGATVPRQLDEHVKEEIFVELGNDAFEPAMCTMLRFSFGLDPEILKDEPLFRALVQDFALFELQWKARDSYRSARLLRAWCVDAPAIAEEQKDFCRALNSFFEDNQARVMQLQVIMGPSQRLAAVRAGAAETLSRGLRKDNFFQNLAGQLTRPCSSCGNPLEGKSCHACKRQWSDGHGACQSRPDVPQSFQQRGAQASDAMPVPSYRRSKKIQTSFSTSGLVCAKSGRKAPEASGAKATAEKAAGEAAFASSYPGELGARYKNKPRHRRKEPSPTMRRLREQVFHHQQRAEESENEKRKEKVTRHKDAEHAQAGSCQQMVNATMDASVQLSSHTSRRSRRKIPQGDSKFARQLALAELMQEDE